MGNVLLTQKRTSNCADSLVKPMEFEEILLNGMKIDANSIKFPCKTNGKLTFPRVPQRRAKKTFPKRYKTKPFRDSAVECGGVRWRNLVKPIEN